MDMTKAIVDCFVLQELNVEELPADVWSYAIAQRWVRLKVEDELNGRLRWARRTSLSDDLLDETIISYLRSQGTVELIDRFYEALDMSELYIGNLIQESIGENDWRIWHTYFRADWLIMEYDEDYRIKVFNEKVASGEWEV
jgi:hypothetical protein